MLQCDVSYVCLTTRNCPSLFQEKEGEGLPVPIQVNVTLNPSVIGGMVKSFSLRIVGFTENEYRIYITYEMHVYI